MTTPDETPVPESAVPAPAPIEAEMPAAPAAAVVPAAQAMPTQPAPYAAPAAPQAYAAPNPMPNTWMNITALITGILGLAIIPIIFGHMGVSQSNKGKADFKWMGIVGLVLGYLTLVAWIIVVVAWTALFAGAAISTN